jgi:hypothetical protein
VFILIQILKIFTMPISSMSEKIRLFPTVLLC